MALIKPSLLRQKPQELGKIKIGGKGKVVKSAGGKQFQLPEKWDHFVVTTRVRGADGNFVRDESIHGHAKVGDKPTSLDALLMFAEVEDNLHTEMCEYQGKQKIISCDGETACNLKTSACVACPRAAGGECGCKPYTRLHLQLMASPTIGGYHVFRSHGWESAANIQSALQEIHARFGTLYQAPVKLVIYPSEDNYNDKKSGDTKTSESWKVGLVLAMSMEEASARMIASTRHLAVTRQELKALSSGVIEDLSKNDIDEAGDLAEEYFPEAGASVSVASQEKLDAFKAENGIGAQPEPTQPAQPAQPEGGVVDTAPDPLAGVVGGSAPVAAPGPAPQKPAEPARPAAIQAAIPEDDHARRELLARISKAATARALTRDQAEQMAISALRNGGMSEWPKKDGGAPDLRKLPPAALALIAGRMEKPEPEPEPEPSALLAGAMADGIVHLTDPFDTTSACIGCGLVVERPEMLVTWPEDATMYCAAALKAVDAKYSAERVPEPVLLALLEVFEA